MNRELLSRVALIGFGGVFEVIVVAAAWSVVIAVREIIREKKWDKTDTVMFALLTVALVVMTLAGAVFIYAGLTPEGR